MDLINTKEFLNAINLKRLRIDPASKLLIQLFRIKRINKFYLDNFNKNSTDFINSLIESLELKYEISEEDLNRIPKAGSFITVSNHPFAGIDGILLLKIISEVRPDYKILADFLLQRISPLHDKIFPFNPFESQKNDTSNFSAYKFLINNLREGNPLGIFPATSSSVFNTEKKMLLDKEWEYSILKFIKKAQVPIVPIHFEGNNYNLFNLLNIILPLLNISKQPSKYLNKRHKIIKIRIGNPISISEQNKFSDISQYGRYLRLKTNFLETPLEIKKFFIKNKTITIPEPIVNAAPDNIIEDEVNKLLLNNYLFFKSANYSVICAPAIMMPNILNEIGRLREITFRAVGEGTNRSIDIDEYDLYYYHLFIWDTEQKKIVGAYRVGKGQEILTSYGKKGFYINTLFRINRKIVPILKESIELGRSFIVHEYQQKPMSLFLLWKGILYFLLKNPEYRYLIGPVSISNQFSKISKKLITDFIKSNYYNYQLAQYIRPKKRFHFQMDDNDKNFIFETTSNDINKLDKFIEDIEPKNIKIPVLLKKYLKLNGKIIGFNIDPKFNNALDGLIILDLFDVPNKTIKSFSKEINDTEILEKFYSKDIDTFNDISKLLKKKKISLLRR